MGSMTSTLCTISAAIMGFCGGLAAWRPDALAAAGTLEEVRTRRLVIVDDHGEERGGLEVGAGSSSARMTLWLGSPGGKGPSAVLWIDQLEGTPEARLMLTSEGGEPATTGRLSLRSSCGLPSANLTFGEDSACESIVLGPQVRGETSALVLDVAGRRTAWPR